MIFSLITLLNSFLPLQNTVVLPEKKVSIHSSPRKIYLRNYKRPAKSREISPKKTEKPWDGHFSAKNFSNDDSPNISLAKIKENLRTSIIALPKWHTQALKDLEVQKDINISRGLSSSSKMILHTDSIKNSQELIAVFVHEMGHITDLGAVKGKYGRKTAFYDGKTPILSDDLSLNFYHLSWINSHQKKNNSLRNDFVSGYAMSDCFEDFAETYTFYRLHGDKFRGILDKSIILKQKYEFMKKYVFGNKEFQTAKSIYTNFQYNVIFDTTLLGFNLEDL